MVLGLMPGHHDAGNEYTSVEDAKNATKNAMNLGLAGRLYINNLNRRNLNLNNYSTPLRHNAVN